MYRYTVRDVEKRIGKPMTEGQKQGLWNCGSLMFMESMINGFYYAKTDQDVEKWLNEVDGFTRGQDIPNRPE